MGFGLLAEERAGSGRLDGKRILWPAQLEHRRGNPVSAALRGSTPRPSRAAPALYCWGGEGQTGARGVGVRSTETGVHSPQAPLEGGCG